MTGFLHEFKKFALKGNVVDMAVGVIIGGAFSKIVNSTVNDIVMPVIGSFAGKGSFGDWFLWLGSTVRPDSLDDAVKSGQPYIAYGRFLQTTLDFLLIAFAVFLLVKAINSARHVLEKPQTAATAPAAPPEDIVLLREIRDALTAR